MNAVCIIDQGMINKIIDIDQLNILNTLENVTLVLSMLAAATIGLWVINCVWHTLPFNW